MGVDMKKCPECKTVNAEISEFCMKCGHKLPSSKKDIPNPPETHSADLQQVGKPKNKINLLLLIISILLLLTAVTFVTTTILEYEQLNEATIRYNNFSRTVTQSSINYANSKATMEANIRDMTSQLNALENSVYCTRRPRSINYSSNSTVSASIKNWLEDTIGTMNATTPGMLYGAIPGQQSTKLLENTCLFI